METNLRAPRGAAAAFCNWVAMYSGDDCVPFPFKLNRP